MFNVYGWDSGSPSYDITFFDMVRGSSTVVSAGMTGVRAGYDSDDAVAGLLLVTPNESFGQKHPYAFPINNPPSLATIRWMVREALNDTESTTGIDVLYPTSPKFPDNEINVNIREAIGMINRYVRRPTILETTSNTLNRKMLESFHDVAAVSFYDVNREVWQEIPKYSRRTRTNTNVDRYWEISAGGLRLVGSFSEGIKLQIEGETSYPVPLRDTDTLDIDPQDYDVLTLYAQGKCMLRVAAQSAQLDRWKEEGKRNDNPITPIAKMMLTEAEERIANRRGPRAVRRFRS